MEIYYAWLIIFAILAYFIVTDSSISQAFVYITDILKNKIITKIWWIRHNPANPVVKYLMWRRAMKMAKELQKELKK